jgi:hypothetical protein
LLSPRQAATDALDRIKGKHCFGILIRGMKVGSMMGRINFHKHPDDDSEKARQLRHATTLHRRRPISLANAGDEPRRARSSDLWEDARAPSAAS